MKKVLYFTDIAPHYRKSLWELLLSSNDFEIHFYFGERSLLGIKTIDFSGELFEKHKEKLHPIKNIWLGKRFLIWQVGVIGECIKGSYDTGMFVGQMHGLSTWIAAIICRVRRKEVVFWGHGIYGREGTLKLFARKVFYRLADKHVLYERRAKRLLLEQGFKADNCWVVFNSLDYDAQKKLREEFVGIQKTEVFPFFKAPDLPVLIFVGRLTAEKKIDLLLDAVNEINKSREKLNVIIIGDGPEKAELIERGKKEINAGRLFFTGSCYDDKINGRYLYCSDLCVSPGNVGLTAIHSLSFGTPVCTHGNLRNQAPEAEAIVDGYNGLYFEENNLDDLVEKIQKWNSRKINRELLRVRCYEIVEKYYNAYYQLSVFRNLFDDRKPEI